jgi:hypothetical protein
MPAIISVLCDGKVYIQSVDNCVRSFKTVREALDYFEKGYAGNHSRGYESSMSACLHYIQFHPKVHEMPDGEDCSSLVDEDVIDLETFKNCRIQSVSGTMAGALCTGSNALSWHESGISPALITH